MHQGNAFLCDEESELAPSLIPYMRIIIVLFNTDPQWLKDYWDKNIGEFIDEKIDARLKKMLLLLIVIISFRYWT